MALTWGRKSESQRRELYYLRSYIWEEVGLDFEHTYFSGDSGISLGWGPYTKALLSHGVQLP